MCNEEIKDEEVKVEQVEEVKVEEVNVEEAAVEDTTRQNHGQATQDQTQVAKVHDTVRSCKARAQR